MKGASAANRTRPRPASQAGGRSGPVAVAAPLKLAALPDEALQDAVQRQTFRYFWQGAHPSSGLALDRRTSRRPGNDLVAIGGSGFGVMALIVATERGWVSRAAALERLERMLATLTAARRYHGAFPHFMDGRTGETIPFSAQDDAADLVETSLLMQGLLCAREYFSRDTAEEASVDRKSTRLNSSHVALSRMPSSA